MSKKAPRKVAKAEVRRVIDDGLKANDALRVQGLGNLLRLRGKKSGLQRREQQRLAGKHGNRHARTQQVDSAYGANADYINGLRMEMTRAGTPVKKQNATSWAVQGHVYDPQGCPVANAEVALYGADQTKIAAAGDVKTNNRGYYLLSYKTTAEKLEKAQLSQQPPTAPGGQETLNIRTQDSGMQRLSSGLRVNRAADVQAAVFVRARDGNDPAICADSTLITPRAGVCSYRDVILNTRAHKAAPEKDRRATRYLGNSATRELHDLKSEKPGCGIDNIRFDHCVNFKTQKEATAAGYDFCAYCFGKEKSKR